MPVIIEANISEVIRDPRLQMRAKLDAGTIEDYAECLDELPPVSVVVGPSGEIWLWDGWHRIEAHIKRGLKKIRCEVTNGTFGDALVLAAGANSKHGLRRTASDKRRSVKNLLRNEHWKNKSDRMIAEVCYVSHPTVATIRKAMQDEEEMSTGKFTSEETREGKDGREQPATKPKPRCERCQRVFGINSNESVSGCTACEDIQSRKEKPTARGKKEEAKPTAIKDAAGKIVPMGFNPIFEMVPTFKDLARLLYTCSQLHKKIEQSPAGAKKLLAKGNFEKMSVLLQRAREKIQALTPTIGEHSACEGNGCKLCQNLGWLTKEEYEREKEGI